MLSIPGFEITRLIGKGGFARVFLAVQQSLEREVALKVMEPQMAGDSLFRERFLKEGKIVARLSSHPNIVTIHDIGAVDGIYYMAMEYVGGGTLRERIRRGLTRHEALRIARQVATALDYAHTNGFIHRDIKPANILFNAAGDAVLSDFGIARPLNNATRLTQAGFTVGTPEYMSPEQALGKPLDGRSDLYSLGLILFEMLAREKPFVSEDAISMAIKHVNEPVPRLPGEYAGYQELIERLLAKKPDERLPDAGALIAYIDRHWPDEPPGATLKQTLPEATLKRVRTLVRQTTQANPPRRWIWGSGLIVLMVSVMLFAGLHLPDSGRPESPHPAALAVPDKSGRPLPYTEKVVRLLEVATLHEDMGRLTGPPGSNACEAYKLVLEINPSNSEASAAVGRIGCHYPGKSMN